MANSAAYGQTEQIANVHRATVVLGFDVIRAMALSYGLFACLDDPTERLLTGRFWAHTIAAAIACQEAARLARLEHTYAAYTIGLLHDIGQAVFAHLIPFEYVALVDEHRETHVPLSLLEQEHFGCTHAEVGAAFLRAWCLPHYLVHAIDFHHRVWEAPVNRRDPSLAVLADIAAYRAGYPGLSDDDPEREWPAGPARTLRLPVEVLDRLVEQIHAQFETHVDLLALPTRHTLLAVRRDPKAA